MWFRLLGPVELVIDGAVVPLGPPQRRAVLAALLYDAGVPVPATTLTQRVWGRNPPPAATAALHSHLARIRRLLRETADRTGIPVALERRGGGYVLEVEPGRVDLLRFRQLAERADEATLALGERGAALREALELWNATPLTGIGGGWADHLRETLTGRRLTVLLRWSKLELELGHPELVIDELTAAVADHPIAEALVAALMEALCAAGRAAEALSCYAGARRRIAEALGSEPGPQLRAVHEALLRGELPRVSSRGGPADLPVPAQLPADVPNFTGRSAELRILDGLSATAAIQAPAVTVCAVSGTAGVGKSALVVHWAHQVIKEFPDGQLFVDLRGYDEDQPVAAGQALAVFLRALGVPGSAVPADIDERAALYRSTVANRRLLVVLDNAAGYDHVRPLLPGSATSLAIVTSRDSIPTLSVRHGARRVDLDLLPTDEAVELLSRLVPDRVAADPAGSAVLAERCAQLPLALRIAAEYLVEHPDVAVSALTEELTDTDYQLDLLDAGGEPRTAVRTVFSWSYRRLSPAAARAFRMLGLPPSADLDRYAAAALLDTDLRATARLLDELVRAHLVRQTRPGRFGMHDLLRTYARELAEIEDGPARRLAHQRLLEHYLALAAAAMDTLVPHERHRRPTVGAPAGQAPDLGDRDSASAWLDANRPALIAATSAAAAQGRPDIAVDLSAVLWRYLDNGAYHPEAVELHRCAIAAADDAGDRRGEAAARRYLGVALSRIGRLREAHDEVRRAKEIFQAESRPDDEAGALISLGAIAWQSGDYAQAYQCQTEAAEILTELGDQAAAAVAVSNVAGVLESWGRYDEAIVRARQALASFDHLGDRDGTARTLGNLAGIFERLGRYDEAGEHYQRCLAVFEEIGGRMFRGRVLGGIASVQQRKGEHDAAVTTGTQALEAARAAGDREGEAAVLDGLAIAYRRRGDLDAAVTHHSRALDVALAIGDRSRSAIALVGLADVLCETGYANEAATHVRAGLAIARDIGDRYAEGRALDGLARVLHAAGATREAREHWEEALRAYADLGVPEADAVRAELASLDLVTY